MKLVYTPNTGRPARVAWLLEEIGQPFGSKRWLQRFATDSFSGSSSVPSTTP